MNKTKLPIIFLIALMLLCSIFVLASCGGGEKGATAPHTLEKLNSPEVVLTNDNANWSTNSLADKFEISIDGVLTFVENSVTSKRLEDGQTFKIRAVGDGINYSNSDWSNSVTYIKPIEPPAPENKYIITWKNGEIVLETDENVEYGTMPTYNGKTPEKEADDRYFYVFSGWTPEISPVTSSVEYTALFTKTLRTYTVTFYSEDGITVLDTVTVEYGSDAVYAKSTPVKNATEGHTYVFEKWVTTQGGNTEDNLSNIIGNRIVYASFKQFVRTVSVYVVSNNTDYGTVSVSVLNNVPYGADILASGNTITVNGQTVTANANAATAQYAYDFVSWTTDAAVGNDTIITANFSRSVKQYTVTWKNGDEVLEVDENVSYGVTPIYNGEIPIKPSDDENIYTFSGWLPTVSSVTCDVTYVAQFTNIANTHTVTFYDDDGTTILGVSVVGHGETAAYPNSLPTKASTVEMTYSFDKWVTENGGNVEATFANIIEDKFVYAKYAASARSYTVTFCDYDGTILSQASVAYGNAATPPGEPERTGFRFDCWNSDYNNITDNITVTAKYVQQFTVEFLDYDNSVIDMQIIDYNGNAIAPENPVRSNYRFAGWNTEFINVVNDLTVKAEYIRQYKVKFLDYDGVTLKEELVDSGSSATPPTNPTLEGYEFIGWNKEYSNILSNLSVTATYQIKTYAVKFVMPDGTVLTRNYCVGCKKYHRNDELVEEKCPNCNGAITKVSEQKVEHGFSAIVPEYSEFFLDGSGDSTKVYGFTNWNKTFETITEDTVIGAVYQSEYTKPIIIIEFSKERNGNANLYVYNKESMMLNAIEFSINFSTAIGKISISTATVNSASPLWVEDSNGNNNNQYVINNNENIFTFAWSDANGKKFDWCSKVLTFSFSTDGAVVGEETFVVKSCSAIVSDKSGEKLEKVTPIVVYR